MLDYGLVPAGAVTDEPRTLVVDWSPSQVRGSSVPRLRPGLDTVSRVWFNRGMETTDHLNNRLVQYRKVGTFRVIGPAEDLKPEFAGGGWFICEAVKAPKKYRDGTQVLWLDPHNVITEDQS